MIRSYGTEAWDILGDAKSAEDLGQDFGATLSEAEIVWLMTREFARNAEDIVWRRTKQGLRLTSGQIDDLDKWIDGQHANSAAAAAK